MIFKFSIRTLWQQMQIILYKNQPTCYDRHKGCHLSIMCHHFKVEFFNGCIGGNLILSFSIQCCMAVLLSAHNNYHFLGGHMVYLIQPNLVILTLKFLLRAGQRANISTANVTVAKECRAVCKRDARHIDANRPAFKDSTPETLKKTIPLIIQILINHAEIWT